ncbi:MAG: RDD family protein [Gammaproteobacteria bacterium]|nr:RDD family protein [Gammaproteobacteria bacterium]
MSTAQPPTNLQLSLPAVGLMRRLFAMFYDGLLLLALLMVATAIGLTFTEGEATDAGNPLMTTWLFLVSFFYFAWPWLNTGQTLGMKTWRMQLVRIDGKPLTLWHLMLRFLSAIPSIGLGGIGLLWMLYDPNHLALHDKFSETRLVDLKSLKQ